jgi:hypothetical protein
MTKPEIKVDDRGRYRVRCPQVERSLTHGTTRIIPEKDPIPVWVYLRNRFPLRSECRDCMWVYYDDDKNMETSCSWISPEDRRSIDAELNPTGEAL